MSAPARPLWRGRALVLVGIVLLALNLRTAVSSLSPILGAVGGDIPLDALGIGVIGMLPPVAFAIAGAAAPWFARRIGLEWAVAVSCLAMVLGPLVRSLATDYATLVLGTALTLAGMGVCNILLPPVVKDYFPDRIGQLTALYATLMSIGTAVPALVAAPLADGAGWRASLALWAIVAAAMLVPWTVIAVRATRDARAAQRAAAALGPEAAPVGSLVRSRVAWAITLAFVVAAINSYATFAWLPALLVDTAGVSVAEAGALLALFGIMGLPTSLAIPVIAPRLRNVGPLVALGVLLLTIGWAGILLAPAVAWLWVTLIGLGVLLFPLCLVLINLRTRSVPMATSLSGFVQSIGYSGGALGPLVVGIVHDATGSWLAPVLLLIGVTLLGLVAAIVLARPLTVEADLER